MPTWLRHLDVLAREYQNLPRPLAQIHALLLTTGFLSLSLRPQTAVYNILIKGCLRREGPTTALRLFFHMLASSTPPSFLTFPSLIKAASTTVCVASTSGLALHSQIIRRGFLLDDYVRCCLVKLYARLGRLGDARDLFGEMPHPDLATCNVMLDALCKNGDVGSALRMFCCFPDRDVISWTTMVNGFVRDGRYCEAVQFFKMLVADEALPPTEATLVCGLSACAGSVEMRAVGRGREIHGYVVMHGFPLTPTLGTALIDMYGKCGHLSAAANVFDLVTAKEVCTWNAMLSALACNGQEIQALELFARMLALGFAPDAITFVAVLTACARVKMVDCGLKWFESMSLEFGIEPTLEHYGCVVDLYGRAGLLSEAVKFVKGMPFEPDASVLGALLGACKVHGNVELAGEVGLRLLALQPWHSGRYMVLSNIYAGAEMWGAASKVKQAMDDGGVAKIAAYSLVDSSDSDILH